MQTNFQNLHHAITSSILFLKQNGRIIKTKEWQAIDSPDNMFEVYNLNWTAPVPLWKPELVELVKPDLPWADIHFKERVSGQPLNPGESYKEWPEYNSANEKFNDENFRKYKGKFAHTYMERMWPKRVNDYAQGSEMVVKQKGIRFNYGDLKDVAEQLKKDNSTRQAYLPIFFPEDTGATEGQRVPCTLGYLFYIRDGQMSIKYYLRSCDALRHFRNDVYLACRLLYWMWIEVDPEKNVKLGNLTMDIGSLHVFEKQKDMI